MFIYFIIVYNKLIKLNNTVNESFATMDVYLKKRWDLIPNLVNVVKGYAKHEKDTLEEIIKLRNNIYDNMSTEEKINKNKLINQSINKIMALAENYPELKANEKLLYAVITVLSNKEGYCYASNNYLADLFNSKPHTISNWVSHLNKLKFIHVELIRDEKNEIIQRRIYINDIPYAIKMTYPYVTKKTEGMLQKRQYNNINNKIDRFFYYIIRI